MAGALALAGVAPAAAAAQGCVPRKNLEAIVDDSGSTAATDSRGLRAQGLRLIMSAPGNESKLLGAVEFGTEANPVFGPGLVRSGRAAFGTALGQRLRSDNGGTNYNAAFDLARAHNPSADARLFLTDGAHNDGDFANGHRGGPPTHAIGLGFLTGADENRLRAIAAETGGSYRRAEDDAQLQPAMSEVSARINCLPVPARYTDALRRGGARTRRLAIAAGVRSVHLTLSWVSAADRFDVGAFRIVRGKRVVATARARRLRVAKRRGATYVTVKLSGLVRGTLRYQVRAARVGAARATLVTQAARSRRR